MRSLNTLLLAGIGSLAFTYAVSAQTVHHMTVRLPDGSVAQIEYAGNVPPRVAIVPAVPRDSDLGAFWGADDPAFARFRQITAAMDREADAMLREAALMLSRSPVNGTWRIDTGDLPPGARSYSFAATLGPNGICSQSVTISRGRNGRPQVQRQQSGNCGGNGNSVVPGAQPEAPAPEPAPAPGVISAKASPPASALARWGEERREATYHSPGTQW